MLKLVAAAILSLCSVGSSLRLELRPTIGENLVLKGSHCTTEWIKDGSSIKGWTYATGMDLHILEIRAYTAGEYTCDKGQTIFNVIPDKFRNHQVKRGENIVVKFTYPNETAYIFCAMRPNDDWQRFEYQNFIADYEFVLELIFLKTRLQESSMYYCIAGSPHYSVVNYFQLEVLK